MTKKKPANFPYLPHTDANRLAMLKTIGVDSFEQLVSHIPKEIRAKGLDLPSGMSELALTQHIGSLASKNKPASHQACFLGAGSYRRFVPSIVPAITSRSEFATAYTPYQAEASQGTLQVIYEFQTAVCLLTGMDIANASIYDGPTACAEAALMACRLTERDELIISQALNSEYASVTQAYAKAAHVQYRWLEIKDGLTDLNGLTGDLKPAAVIVQYPNFFGGIEDLQNIAKAVHALGSLLIVVSDPISLGLLAPPGDFNADMVVGDAQQCGNFLSFGGPSAGYIACRKDFVRQLPGRLAGMTLDAAGNRAYTLTLQTREQHIRRAKATSNICTNQTLNTLAMLVYLTAMGPSGLQEIASLSMQRAHYLAEQLTSISGVKLAFNAPFLNEFAITTSKPSRYVLEELLKKGILGGFDLSTCDQAVENGILIAVTEMNSRAELDSYVHCLKAILSKSADHDTIEKPSSVSLLRFDEASSAVK
jgi:glycine dehydrogenase subunit 1